MGMQLAVKSQHRLSKHCKWRRRSSRSRKHAIAWCYMTCCWCTDRFVGVGPERQFLLGRTPHY